MTQLFSPVVADSLYLPCESACSSRWSSDVITSTLMLTAACVSLQGADCGGILSPTTSLAPNPPSLQPHHAASIFNHTILPPSSIPPNDWVWHSHKAWRLPAGHCPFSCWSANKKKDHPQMHPHKDFREEKLECFQFSAEKCHIFKKQTWLGVPVSSASQSRMYHLYRPSGPQLVYPRSLIVKIVTFIPK